MKPSRRVGDIGNRSMPHIGKDLVSHLRTQFELHAETRCVTFLNESGRHLLPEVTSFADLDRDSREIAAGLSRLREAERPVLLLFEPGIDFWRAFLGCLYAGVIAVPTPLPLDERSMKRVAGILRDADSSLALTTENLRGPLSAGIASFDLARPLRCLAIGDARLADADSWTMPHLAPDAVAFLQYTSGSTGDPKGVAVTHGNVMSNEAAMSEALGADSTSVLVAWIPHWHDMGLMGQLLAYFNGANLVAMSPLAFLKQPIRLLKAISDYRGTMSAAPNFAYDLIARRVTPELLAGLDLSSWEVALNGAEPVRHRTVERITNLLAPAGFAPSTMRPGYGMAEVTLMATVCRGTPRHLEADADALEQNRYTPADGRAVSLMSSGEPAPGVDVRIVNHETCSETAEDVVGEIWLRSTSVARGYHNRPAETTERFHARMSDGEHPYLRTGDLGLLHENELYVTGRLKDLLIVNGRNLYPQDIEEFVQDVHPALAGSRGCVVSVDIDDAERLVLIQAVKPELLGDMRCEELAGAVKGAVARAFDVPAPAVVLVERTGIHLTTSGKVQRASMRTALLKGELTDLLHKEALR